MVIIYINPLINRERCAEMLRSARESTDVSIRSLAAGIGVTEKTLRNWEAGLSLPDLTQMFTLFSYLNLSPVPYIQQWLYPSEDSIRGPELCRKLICDWVQNIASDHQLEELAFMLCGQHGSSPASVLEMVTADLQCDMRDRYSIATAIAANYRLAEARGSVDTTAPAPNMQRLDDAINLGLRAAIAGVNSYSQVDA